MEYFRFNVEVTAAKLTNEMNIVDVDGGVHEIVEADHYFIDENESRVKLKIRGSGESFHYMSLTGTDRVKIRVDA